MKETRKRPRRGVAGAAGLAALLLSAACGGDAQEAAATAKAELSCSYSDYCREYYFVDSLERSRVEADAKKSCATPVKAPCPTEGMVAGCVEYVRFQSLARGAVVRPPPHAFLRSRVRYYAPNSVDRARALCLDSSVSDADVYVRYEPR